MGNSVGCNCESQKDKEAAAFSPRTGGGGDIVHPVAAVPEEKEVGGGVPPEIAMLNGAWRTEGDDQTMGTILNGVITWDGAFNHKKTALSLIPGLREGNIEMELMGATHRATCVRLNGDVRLKWSDGELWTKM